MNDVCATVGMENLKHFDSIVSTHRNNAKFYDEVLKDINGLELLKREEGHNSAFWIYSMLVDNRDGFYKWMDEFTKETTNIPVFRNIKQRFHL